MDNTPTKLEALITNFQSTFPNAIIILIVSTVVYVIVFSLLFLLLLPSVS